MEKSKYGLNFNVFSCIYTINYKESKLNSFFFLCLCVCVFFNFKLLSTKPIEHSLDDIVRIEFGVHSHDIHIVKKFHFFRLMRY